MKTTPALSITLCTLLQACSGPAGKSAPNDEPAPVGDSNPTLESGTSDPTDPPCPGLLTTRPLANGWIGARGPDDCLAVTGTLVRTEAELAAALATVDRNATVPKLDWKAEHAVFATTGTCMNGGQALLVECAQTEGGALLADFAVVWPEPVTLELTHAWSVTGVTDTIATELVVGSVEERYE